MSTRIVQYFQIENHGGFLFKPLESSFSASTSQDESSLLCTEHGNTKNLQWNRQNWDRYAVRQKMTKQNLKAVFGSRI